MKRELELPSIYKYGLNINIIKWSKRKITGPTLGKQMEMLFDLNTWVPKISFIFWHATLILSNTFTTNILPVIKAHKDVTYWTTDFGFPILGSWTDLTSSLLLHFRFWRSFNPRRASVSVFIFLDVKNFLYDTRKFSWQRLTESPFHVWCSKIQAQILQILTSDRLFLSYWLELFAS